MNYYERHLGDYARDTAHLSILEHGAYTLLLDRLYATEQGIPAEQVYRLARARTADERKAVDVVLAEYFVLENNVYNNGRASREIARAQAKIAAARSNGKTGGRPKANPAVTQQEPTGFPLGSISETQMKALQTPDSRLQSPDTKHQTPDTHTHSQSACEYAQFVNIKAAYPAGTYGQHHWQSAERSIQRLCEDGQATPDVLLSAVSNFAQQQTAMGRIGTQFITSPNKFFETGMWQGPFPLPKPTQKVQPEKPDLTGWIPPEYRDQEEA